MRPIPVLLLLLTACGPDDVDVRGTLAEGTAASQVWVVGDSRSAAVEGGSFHLDGLTGDSLEILLTSGTDTARMYLSEVEPGARIRLDEVWTEDGVAFPTRVALEGVQRVSVNGLRMASPDAIPEEVELGATVLAASEAGDALLVRPGGTELPDLRVVVTPGTVVQTEDGDPVESPQLGFGDSLTVVGRTISGYVTATRITLAREAAAARDDEGDGASAVGAAGAAAAAATAKRATSSRRSGASEDQEKRKGGKGWWKGRGKGKGKGKGRNK